MPKSKIYTAEFKESAVKLAVESDQSIRKTAKELGVKESTLHTWIAKYHSSNSKPQHRQAKHNSEHVYDELRQLKKENARLKRRTSHFKKGDRLYALWVFFAKECL